MIELFRDVNVKDDSDWTPLIIASSAGHLDIVRMLVERGASVNEVTGSDRNSELARMLSGSDGSDAATAHATELLDLADQHRGAGV